MKKTLIAIILLLSTINTAAYAAWQSSPELRGKKAPEKHYFMQKGNCELGGVLGMPSGLNLRYWFVDPFGFDFTIGSTIKRDFIVTFDLLFEFFDLYSSPSLHLRFFFGAGTLVGYQDHGLISNVRIRSGYPCPS